MGNTNSVLKSKKSTTLKQIPSSFNQVLSDSNDNEKRLTYYSDDISDIDRLHTRHFCLKYVFQESFSSPIKDKLIQGGCKVLDVGCGPGTWLLDLSNEYEDSQFFGLDIKPLFPKEIKPNNLKFMEADLFDGLPFDDNEFDFVHMEAMIFVITSDKWNFVLSELIRVTKLGGYVEISEPYIIPDDSGPVYIKLLEGLCASSLKQNIDMKLIINLDSVLKSHPNIGEVFRDEGTSIIGPNGGKIGLVSQYSSISFFTSEMAVKGLTDELKISDDEYKIMVEKDLIEEFKQKHHEIIYIRFWAQKV